MQATRYYVIVIVNAAGVSASFTRRIKEVDMADPIDDNRQDFLQAITDGLTDELVCDLFYIDREALTHRLTWDVELEADMKHARAKGILMVLREMLQTTTGQNYWLQRVPRQFDYMLDKDRASRVDADVFSDGAVIKFLDKVQSTIYDESLE